MKKAIIKEKKKLRKRTVRNIRKQDGISCKRFRTDLRGTGKVRRMKRMKDDEGRMAKGKTMCWK